MNTGWKKAAVIGLSASLALAGLSGCSGKNEFNAEAAAVTVNDDTIPAGLLAFATRYAQAQYESLYQAYGMNNAFNQDLYGNGTTLGQSLVSGMASQLANAYLAEQKMEEYGVSLTEEEQASIAEAASAFLADNEEEVLELIGADQDTVERYLELLVIQNKMEEAMSADVDTEVSDEEAAQRRIRYTLFTPVTEEETEADSETSSEVSSEAAAEAETADADDAETEESETEDASEAQTASLEENDAAATQSAQETEADSEAVTEAETETETQTETEEAAEEVSEQVSEEASESEEETEGSTEEATEAETETEDPETAAAKAKAYDKAVELIGKIQAGEDFETASGEVDPDATCSTMTFGESNGGQEELLAATDGLADGTLVEEPVETDSGYYVVYLETQLDREATDSEKDRIVEQRKQDQISDLYTQWQEESDIETDAGVLADITFDFSLEQYVETEASTESVTESVTEAVSEAESEAVTEAESGAESEDETENASEKSTEAVSEAEEAAETEAADEAETDSVEEAAETQAASESVTEAATEE
ncbi:MAG TPA: hypothetical protein IAB84_04590 [Candidatus Choladousia intestinigallinarum]|nr:hypothetical protein [Candidatus Choladousia intestinigallinarum]